MTDPPKEMTQLEDQRPDEGGLELPSKVENWIMPYVEDTMLRPVLLVLILHLVAFMAPVLVLAVRDLRTGAIAGVGVMLYFSARIFRYDWRVRRRPAAFSKIVIAVWLLSFAAAYVGYRGDYL